MTRVPVEAGGWPNESARATTAAATTNAVAHARACARVCTTSARQATVVGMHGGWALAIARPTYVACLLARQAPGRAHHADTMLTGSCSC